VEVITGGADRSAELPVVIAIHGLGDTPEHMSGLFADAPFAARFILPRGTESLPIGYSWFPIHVPVRPDDPVRIAPRVQKAAQRLCRFVASAALSRKPLVLGHSQGGMLAYTMAVTCPEDIGLAAPVAGFLPPPLLPDIRPRHYRPIRAFHSIDDRLVPHDFDARSVDGLRALGLDATLQSFPGGEHRITPDQRDALLKLIANW